MATPLRPRPQEEPSIADAGLLQSSGPSYQVGWGRSKGLGDERPGEGPKRREALLCLYQRQADQPAAGAAAELRAYLPGGCRAAAWESNEPGEGSIKGEPFSEVGTPTARSAAEPGASTQVGAVHVCVANLPD